MSHLVWSPDGLSADEISAILYVAAVYGKCWKSHLSDMWYYQGYPLVHERHHAALNGLRDRLGSTGLRKIKLTTLALQLQQNAVAPFCGEQNNGSVYESP